MILSRQHLPEYVDIEPGTTLPDGFIYTDELIFDTSLEMQQGCSCSDCHQSSIPCPCLSSHHLLLLDPNKRLVPLLDPNVLSYDETIFECSAHCSCPCSLTTTSIVSQHHSFLLRATPHKGIGVFTQKSIPRGSFICNYAGKVLSLKDAHYQQKKYDQIESTPHQTALLFIREQLPSGTSALRTQIDATHHGNISRFFNHSCDGGNLLLVLVRQSLSLLPRVAFFAAKDIGAGEELTFSYGAAIGGDGGGHESQGKACFCNSKECKGYLPRENI